MTIRRCKLTEIAQIERGTPGKIYPAGTVYIQVSASNGQVGMTKTPQAIEARYAAIIPQINLIPAYFKIAVERAVPEFMAKTKQQ